MTGCLGSVRTKSCSHVPGTGTVITPVVQLEVKARFRVSLDTAYPFYDLYKCTPQNAWEFKCMGKHVLFDIIWFLVGRLQIRQLLQSSTLWSLNSPSVFHMFWIVQFFICWIYFLFWFQNELKNYLSNHSETWWQDEQLRALQTVLKQYEEYSLEYSSPTVCVLFGTCVHIKNTARPFVNWCRKIKRQRILDIKTFWKYTIDWLH